MAILTDLRDPRIQNVTVTRVEVSGDLRNAKVHVSIMGDEKQQELSMHGLRSAVGFLQGKVGDRVDTRYTPRLKFVLDKGVKHSIEVTRILGELREEREEHHDTAPADSSSDDQAGSSPDNPTGSSASDRIGAPQPSESDPDADPPPP